MSKNEQFEYRIIYEFSHGKIKRSKAATLISKTQRSVTRIANRVERIGISSTSGSDRKVLNNR